MTDISLIGLDGSNPLAFLAALGVLEATAERMSDARLAWRYEGGWQPVLTSACTDMEELVDRLDVDRRGCVEDPVLALEYGGKRDLKPPPSGFRQFLDRLSGVSTPANRRSVDWAASFATEVAVDNNGNTKPTALHFTAGQQQFLQMAIELVRNVTRDDLREALQGPWRYDRPLPVMGWDATSSRDYALRASDPSTDKKHGVPGADWLAIRGLTFFPTVPRGRRVMTTGCVGSWKDGQFHWPIWTVSLNRPVVHSVLCQNMERMTKRERRARGIDAVFSSRISRHPQGGRGSFEPATVI